MRKTVSFTTHPDYLAVEKKYMAFLTIEKQLTIEKIISTFHFTEQQAMNFFTSLADEACTQLKEMSDIQINVIVERNNIDSSILEVN
jgi:hypothetical protein